MNFYPLGRPATDGNGTERYSVRFVLWIAGNASSEALERLGENKRIEISRAEKPLTLEKRPEFYILKSSNIDSLSAAQSFANQIAAGLIRFSAQTGVAIQFSFPPSEILRDRDPGFDREMLDPASYPSVWTVRSDGTRTDGGILTHQTCILPEHERIWEYPGLFGRPYRPFDLRQFSNAIERAARFSSSQLDNSLLCAAQALWAAFAQNDRRLTYMLLVTALDVLAEDERVSNWSDELEDVLAKIKQAIAGRSREQHALLEKLSRKIDEIGKPGMAERVRSLVLRAFAFQDRNASEARNLHAEISKILGKRGGLAHGGKLLSVPSVGEIERLREIVATALDTRLGDSADQNTLA